MDIPYLTPLPVDMLRRLGIPSDWNFGLADRVRFSELDALGHVNNAAYLSWFENVRLPYLAQARVTDYGPSAPRLVIAELGVRYLKEILRGRSICSHGPHRHFAIRRFRRHTPCSPQPQHRRS